MSNAEKRLNRRTDKPISTEHPATKWLKRNEDYQDEPEEEEQPAESFAQKLPRNLLTGLAGLGHATLNAPHDIAKWAEDLSGPSNRRAGIDESKRWIPKLSELIPYQEEHNYAEMLGQKGPGTLADVAIQKGVEHAPEIMGLTGLVRAGLRAAPVTARRILNLVSHHKAEAQNVARQDYRQLFQDAAQQGVQSAVPTRAVRRAENQIVNHSTPKYHESLQLYLNNPSVENAHWAQSELGSFIRHLESIEQRTGLTPTQQRTYRAALNARRDIRDSMFGNNAFGRNPQLAERYNQLSNEYRENVIPYNRLEDLSEFEEGRMRPKKALKGLTKDEQFMIDLAHRYPGIALHSPFAKKLKLGLAGGAASGVGALLGYKGLKSLLR